MICFDRKNGPIKESIFDDMYLEKLIPTNLKITNNKIIKKNSNKYFNFFIF